MRKISKSTSRTQICLSYSIMMLKRAKSLVTPSSYCWNVMAFQLKRHQLTISTSLSLGKLTNLLKVSHSIRISTLIKQLLMIMTTRLSFFQSKSIAIPRRAALTPQVKVLQRQISLRGDEYPLTSARNLVCSPSACQIYKRSFHLASKVIRRKTLPSMMSK